MRALKTKIALIGLAAFGLFMSGCLLSGTFVIEEEFSYTAGSSFYHYDVDITDEPDWKDHKDNIDMIDVVGFEMTLDNPGASEVLFSIYIAPATDAAFTDAAQVVAGAIPIIRDLKSPAPSRNVTYAESLGMLENLTKLKELTKTGKFHYYGIATGAAAGTFKVTKGKIIITVSASK